MPDRPLSGLVVAVPEAEVAVAALRHRLDSSAALGVPAHVTALFPFAPPSAVTADVLARVAAVVRGVPAFGYRFSRTAWFGDTVLWLAPEDPAPFRELTARLAAAFPEHPPYGGAFADVVPHLTVGHEHLPAELAAAERDVLPRLPVTGTATEVLLLAQEAPGGHWHRRAAFPLGPRQLR